MALVVPHLNLVRHSVSGTPGQGTFTLGPVISGFLSIADAGGVNGRTYSYGAEGSFSGGVATKRECGQGVWASGAGTLTRATVKNSTAGGTTKETFTSDCEIVITPLSSDIDDIIATAQADVALTDAATIAVDWSSGVNWTVTLTTSRILGNPTNGVAGTWRSLLVTQPAAGTAVLTFGNQWVFPNAEIPVIGLGNAAKTRLCLYCRTASIFEAYMPGPGLA